MTPFLVSEFGKSAISNLVKECFGSDFPDILRKRQIDYIYRYLKDLGAKSVLLESEYVDKDFLEDYAKFYVRRFSGRGHRCARLHFFREAWEHKDFEAFLSEPKDDGKLSELQENYLGFVVVKPLPKTVIGKTCLKLYDTFDKDPFRAVIRRTCRVNLFGIDLNVESVAFQEQDKVVSACAATSIWSALHALERGTKRGVPSCSEITTNAINFIPDSSNSFPSRELTNKQMLRALDVARFRHHSHTLRNASASVAMKTIECHIRSGLPLIFGAQVFRIDDEAPKPKGFHAATILGFRFDGNDRALYIHDDRLGPFARATVASAEELLGKDATTDWCLVLQEKDDHGNWLPTKEVLSPDFLIGITNKKAGLPLSLVLNTCELIRRIYRSGVEFVDQSGEIAPDLLNETLDALTFDVALAEVSTLKREVWANENLDNERRLELLTAGLARFQWRANFYYRRQIAFTMLLDATDIAQGDAVSFVLKCNLARYDAIMRMLEKGGIMKIDPAEQSAKDSFIASFRRRISPTTSGLRDYLDATFGQPRAPSKLKSPEVEGGEINHNRSLKHFYEADKRTLEEVFHDMVDRGPPMIWIIDHEGTLVVGKEEKELGHPTLTNFKPARIGGELHRRDGGWFINSKSGRYSKNYPNAEEFLQNAVWRFKTLFPQSRDRIFLDQWNPAA